jgi:cobalt-zinc-cadmium efflux system outer membrane protein
MPSRHPVLASCRAALIAGVASAWGCASSEPGRRDPPAVAALVREGIPLPPDDRGARPAAPAAARPRDLPPEGPVSLADLLRVAEDRNPDLAAARSRVGVAAGLAWQAALYPNPFLEVESDEVPFRSGFGQAISTVSLTQPIVLGGRLRAATEAAKAEEAARFAELDLRVREVFGEISQLHARLLAIRQAQALYAELEALGRETYETARNRFEARAVPETEVLRPQIELYQIDLARQRLAQEKSSATRQLALLLGGAPVDPDRLAGELPDDPAPVDQEALAAAVRAAHPALVAADRGIDAAAARLEQVEQERVPDLELRVGAGYKGDEDEGIGEIGAGVTLPLWDGRQGDRLAARFDLMRARQERIAKESELLRELAAAYGEYEAVRVQARTLRDQLVPAAQRAYAQTQDMYRAGRAAFLEMLEAQRTLTEARASLVELSGAAAAARARLVQIAGPLPEPSNPPRVQEVNP